MSLNHLSQQPGAYLAGLLALLLLLYFLGHLLARLLQRPPDPFPYVSRKTLFTPAERFFFGVLLRVIDERFVIFGKVRLADIIRTRPGMDRSTKVTAFNKICGKHLDFVICRVEDLSVAGVVELDDRSHESKTRRARDEFVDGALSAAGISIAHVKLEQRYSLSRLQAQLEAELGIGAEESDTPAED